QADQGREARAAHDAVGVEDDHVPVLAAPAPAEVGDVAALALDAVPPPAIEDPAESADGGAQVDPCLAFGDQRVGLAAVAEDEEVEALRRSGGSERLPGRPDAGEHAWHVLVANRHDERGARLRGNGRPRWRRPGDGVTIAPQAQEHEPAERRPESE